MTDKVELQQWEKDALAQIADSLKDSRRCRGCGCPQRKHAPFRYADPCLRCECRDYKRPRYRWSYFLTHQLKLRWYFAVAGFAFAWFVTVLCTATAVFGNQHMPGTYELLMWPAFFVALVAWVTGQVLAWYRKSPRGRM